jgi:hypothetical protein
MIPLLEQLLEKEDIFKPLTLEEWADRMVSAGLWTKNPDGTYSAEGDVDLSHKGLTKLSIGFKEVGEGFYCSFNQLTSLEGAPEKVGGDFYCSHNQLTTLEGAPQKVGGSFWCNSNQLTSLEGIGIVKGDIFCSDNPVPEKELLKTIGK